MYSYWLCQPVRTSTHATSEKREEKGPNNRGPIPHPPNDLLWARSEFKLDCEQLIVCPTDIFNRVAARLDSMCDVYRHVWWIDELTDRESERRSVWYKYPQSSTIFYVFIQLLGSKGIMHRRCKSDCNIPSKRFPIVVEYVSSNFHFSTDEVWLVNEWFGLWYCKTMICMNPHIVAKRIREYGKICPSGWWILVK